MNSSRPFLKSKASDSPTGKFLNSSLFRGPHNFKVDVEPSNSTSYIMSEKLQKLFAKMNCSVPFRVQWNGASGLKVRALISFSIEGSAAIIPVRRCPEHKDEWHESNEGYQHAEHVLSCLSQLAVYEKDSESGRLSVTVPLDTPQKGTSQTIQYRFMCKSSCPGGINRTPIRIIFTLEDSEGRVVGRDSFSTKVCSRPKRNMRQEEEQAVSVPSEDSSDQAPENRAKRSKIELYQIGEIEVEVKISIPVKKNKEVELNQLLDDLSEYQKNHQEISIEVQTSTVCYFNSNKQD